MIENIEIKGITVLTGYNGVGKSRACQLVYQSLQGSNPINNVLV